MAYSATLLLHDPHAEHGDRSHERLTLAAHAILDLVYLICSTSYDITRLDPAVIVRPFIQDLRSGISPVADDDQWCWSTAAQELVRQMQHTGRTGQTTQVAVLRSEIEVIR